MPTKFSQRSYEKELLDEPHIPKELLIRNLRELELVNTTLGGHAITIAGIKRLIIDKRKTYTLVDIGCGGGDALIHIAKWARGAYPEITGITSSYETYLKANPTIDIVHCSLFCHHLTDDELLALLNHIKKQARRGFVINDLHRHWFAYYSIKFLTRLLNGSSLVKNDAPLSVLRGFKKSELKKLLQQAGKDAEIKWRWEFSYLVVQNKQN